MTVSELIEELKDYPGEASVALKDPEYGGVLDGVLEKEEISLWQEPGSGRRFVLIHIPIVASVEEGEYD